MPDRVFEPTLSVFWCGLHMSHFDNCQLTLIWLTHITLNYWKATDSLWARSPIWASEESLARTREQGARKRRAGRKEGQETELVATGVQFNNQVRENAVLQFRNGQIYNVFVGDCDGELSSTLQYGRLFKSKGNEDQSIEFSSKRLKFDIPVGKTGYHWLKTLLCTVAKVIYN